MRIAVIGAGGIGGIYGAALAKSGADVTFVARGAHLAAMRENGLRIEGDRGDTHIQPAKATANIAGIGVVVGGEEVAVLVEDQLLRIAQAARENFEI